MKKIFLILLIFGFSVSLFSQTEESSENNNDFSNEIAAFESNELIEVAEADASIVTSESDESNESAADDKSENKLEASVAGVSEIPAKKKPKPVDSEKAAAAAKKDENEKDEENNRNTVKYGVASEIVELINKLIENDDPRFTTEIYNLFQNSRSDAVRQVILKYFKKYEDPCLEDFAVTVLNDPYDEKNDLVKAVFEYTGAVKCKAAIPAVLTLIEGENENYFNDALICLGEIGGAKEAVYLAEYLDRSDLSVIQRQSLMRVLGKMQALETWDKLVEILEDTDENTFVRMYAAESIGLMKEKKSIPVLAKQFEASDPNLRQYVIKGLKNFENNEDAKAVILEGIRDDHYKVRLESISSAKDNKLIDAIPYLIYRAKNDKEKVVKDASYDAIACLCTKTGNDFRVSQLTEKKSGDIVRAKVVEVLMKYGDVGEEQILALVDEVLADDKRKSLRYAMGKEFAKYDKVSFSSVCKKYLESKDATTVGYGLDMYKTGKYPSVEDLIRSIAEDKKANQANRARAKRLMNIEDETEDKKDEKK